MDAILLVGGFGKRLLPLTQSTPKPLIPLANMPFVERQVAWLRDAGVDHVILSLHYNAERFRAHFARQAWGIDISFAEEDTPLGTGGAIKNCERFLRAGQCIICNGDIFTDLDLAAMLDHHDTARARVSIALKEVDDPSRFGVIETNDDGRILSFTEKPPRHEARSHDINAGIYIFEREVFDAFPDGICSVERDIFPKLLARDVPMFGYTEHPYWTDLGTPGDYLQAHRDILAGRVHLPLQAREIRPGIWVGQDVEVADSALLRPPLLLGDRVRIGDGAFVGPMVVLGAGVHIHPQALVRDSIIWDHAHILPESTVLGCVIGRNGRVGGQVSGGLLADGEQLIGSADERRAE
jgi:mannose-1-phosphate guanylyltransferase